MTPELRALLERHPAPWSLNYGSEVLDANGEYVTDWDGAYVYLDRTAVCLSGIFVHLVNAAASEKE